MRHTTSRLSYLMAAVVVVGAGLAAGAGGEAAAAPPGRCPMSVVVVRNGIPDYEKRWCDSQYQTMINDCNNRFHDDSTQAHRCIVMANQWYAECLRGEHLHYRLADAVPADRLRP